MAEGQSAAADGLLADSDGGHRLATEELWRRLARPFDIGEVCAALLGIPADVVAELADAVVAAGDEAAELLEVMPTLVRRLRMGSSRHVERSQSGIRGPVLWAETVAARSATYGHDGVYVCSIPGRDYDVIENRILVAALRTLVDAGTRLLGRIDPVEQHDRMTARARANTDLAARYLGHRAFIQVQGTTKSGRRSLRSIAAGRNAAAYRPAVALLERAAEPLEVEELLPYCTRSTRAHHRMLLAAIDAMETIGRPLPALRPEADALVVGPFEYVHPGHDRTGSPDIALLSDVHTMFAFDPSRVGAATAIGDRAGARRLVVVSKPSELIGVLESLRG